MPAYYTTALDKWEEESLFVSNEEQCISAKKVRRDFQGLVLEKQRLSLGRTETLPPLHIGADQLSPPSDIRGGSRAVKTSSFSEDIAMNECASLTRGLKHVIIALVLVNDCICDLSALNVFHERGLNIPRDVAIIGFDDMYWIPSLDPPLTAVAQPTYELGCTAANLLLQRIADKYREIVEMKLEPTLIIRDSCGHNEKRGQNKDGNPGA